MRTGRWWLDIALVATFLLALAGPAIDWLVRGIPVRRRLPEERMSAPLPALPRDLASAETFARSFEDWFGDSLGLRPQLLGMRSRLLAFVLETSPTPACILGRDGWVFLTQDRTIEAERGTWPMTSFELERWSTTIAARRRACERQGAEYLLVLVPDKPFVHADRMPAWFGRLGPSRLEQLAAHLSGNPAFLDLRAALDTARQADLDHDHTFFPYGSHWTDRGTIAGVNAILERLRESPRFAALPPFDPAGFVWWPHGFEIDSWAARLYLKGALTALEPTLGHIQGAQPLEVAAESTPPTRIVTTIDDATLPRILVFHDSFGIPVQKFVAHRASRSVCLWSHDFDESIVAEEKPDVVIELHVDRVLIRPPHDDLADLRAAAAARFESATRSVWKLDADRDKAEMAARGGVDLVRTVAGLRVETEGRSLLQLPEAALVEGDGETPAPLLMCVEIDAEAKGELIFYYRTNDEMEYVRRHAIATSVTAGRNRFVIDLSIPGIRGPLVFGAEVGGRPYEIVSMEVREG